MQFNPIRTKHDKYCQTVKPVRLIPIVGGKVGEVENKLIYLMASLFIHTTNLVTQ